MEPLMTEPASELSESLTPQHLDETLRRITLGAVEALDDVAYASITIRHVNGRLETVAPTDLMLCDLDAAQYSLREGPCYDAATDVGHVASPDLAQDPRCPRYAEVAARAGIHAQLGIRLFDAPQAWGALNLYSHRVGAFANADAVASLFAHHSTLTLQYARELHAAQSALEVRQTVGAAVGIAMERYGLSESRAFALLNRLAARHDADVLAIARSLIAASEERNG